MRKYRYFSKFWIMFLLAIGLVSCQDKKGHNCSTFMLKTENAIYVGHNLDEDPDLHVTGMVCINKRGITREGITWYELIADPPDFEKVLIPFKEKAEPKIRWTAKYGSITFNSEGLDFPDGGINEKGLSVFEMSMGETRHSVDPSKPTLFITLWIQYQLDNYTTVDEVAENIRNINQQGWAWHYFVSDKTGDYAIIEYLNGEVVIHKGEDAPYSVLCNTAYRKELARVNDYDGFWGEFLSLLSSTPRFVRASKMITEYAPEKDDPPKEYAFEILDEIKISGWNKWGILVDVSNRIVYYYTNKNRQLKYFAIDKCDFTAGTPTKMLNMHLTDISGDVSSRFEDYSYDLNYNHNLERAEWLFKERFYGLIDNGVTPEVYAGRFADYTERMRNKYK